MSTTRNWMHAEDWRREPDRKGPPLVGVILWVLGLVITALGAFTLQRFTG